MKAITTYLVWKDPKCNGSNPEWVQLTRKQFHALVKSPECVGRYFERLGSTEADFSDGKYVMETTERRYKEYLKEKRHAQHLSDSNPGYQVVSYHELEIFEDCYGEELLCDDSCNVEAECLNKILLESLRKHKGNLSSDELWLIDMIFEQERSQPEVAELLGISHQAVSKRLGKLLEKLRKKII